MAICAEFAGRDKSTCTRGDACICKKESKETKKPQWNECSLCAGSGELSSYNDKWICHQCNGSGGYWDSK